MEKIKILGMALVMGFVARSGYCSDALTLPEINNNFHQHSEPTNILREGEPLTLKTCSLTILSDESSPRIASEGTLHVTGSLYTNGKSLPVDGTLILGNYSEAHTITEPGLYSVIRRNSSELDDTTTMSSRVLQDPAHLNLIKLNQGGKFVYTTSSYLVKRVSELEE